MKITKIEALHLRLPDVNERCDGSQETLVVKVHTDDGQRFPIVDGLIRVPEEPGLGVELDEAVVAKYRVG